MNHRICRIVNHPLATLALEVLAVYLVLRLISPYVGTAFDLVLTTALAIAFVWTVGLQGLLTRVWTHRGLGFFGVQSGDALLYIALGVGVWTGFRAGMLDIARAFLAVGVSHLLWGLIEMQRQRRKDGES